MYNKLLKKPSKFVLTCKRLLMTIGIMDNGNRNILKRANETKALELSKTLLLSDRIYDAKEMTAT